MPDDYGNPDPDWLKIDWRQHLHRVELPGGEVNYAEIGEGEPIVFVHGISGSWQNWLENLPHFGRTHRAIALDLPGFGASPMPSWPIDMPAYGRLLHDFCEKLGIGSGATLVGNSMGGFVAAEAVLVSAGPLRPPGPGLRRRASSTPGCRTSAAGATSQAWNTFGRPLRRRRALRRQPPAAPATRCSASSSATRAACARSCSGSRWPRACPARASPTRSTRCSTTTPATASKRSRSRR